jgi:sugar phosphate isomerase/epimerase
MSSVKRTANAIVQATLLLLAAACADPALESPESYSSRGNIGASNEGELDDKALSPITLQAEASTSMDGCQVVASRSGYPGYVDYGGLGTWTEWNNVRVDHAGRYRLSFRYANGAAGPRRCDAIVNGKKVGEATFNITGSWNRYVTTSLETSLVAGDNTIRVMANTSTGGPNLDWMNVTSVTRGLYTWTFGGLEELGAADTVALLRKIGYAGIVVDTSRAGALQSYLSASQSTADFRVVAAYVAVQLNRGERLSDARHKATIDALAQAGQGDLWMTFRDDNRTQTEEALTSLVSGVVAYAQARGVRVVWYPHNDNIYETTEEAMTLVNAIDAPNFGVALNLIHELRAGHSSSDSLKQVFGAAGHKLFAVTLTGTAQDLSTIRALHESTYDLRPFIQVLKDSGFSEPIGFLNHTLTRPLTYLPLSLGYWREQW